MSSKKVKEKNSTGSNNPLYTLSKLQNKTTLLENLASKQSSLSYPLQSERE